MSKCKKIVKQTIYKQKICPQQQFWKGLSVATSGKNCLGQQFAKLGKFEQMIHNNNEQSKIV